MPSSTYEVPLVPADLRREETIHQICDSLQHLQTVANDVFDRIGNRVAKCHGQLRAINHRVELAQAKVDAIKGSKKATRVFSSAKFPAGENAGCLSLYAEDDEKVLPSQAHHGQYQVQSGHAEVDAEAIKDKLQFYNVHLDVEGPSEREVPGEGLGTLPSHVSSVSSLLLFNTSENPYKKYVLLDPLGVVTKTRQPTDEGQGCLAEAPSTITQREGLDRMSRENIAYVPPPGIVPDIATPDFLPELFGVADDLAYTADLGPSIAPSVLAALPEMDPTFDEGPALPSLSSPPTHVPPSRPPPPETRAPPMPTSPPSPPTSAPHSSSAPPPSAAPRKISSPPPTSAPPPISAPRPPSPPPTAVSAPEDGGRSDLLASIRAGKSLRTATKAERKEKKKQEVEAASGGDIMSSLLTRIQQRRKGMSGTTGPESGRTTDRDGVRPHRKTSVTDTDEWSD